MPTLATAGVLNSFMTFPSIKYSKLSLSNSNKFDLLTWHAIKTNIRFLNWKNNYDTKEAVERTSEHLGILIQNVAGI